jgi:hypothetical protein
MGSEQEVIQLAASGDGYLACERGLALIRKFKRANQLSHAMIFLMRLAHILANRQIWDAAIACARRSIDMFPRSWTTISIELKEYYFSFVDILTPDAAAASADLYGFLDQMMQAFPGVKRDLLQKQASLASAAGSFFQAQKSWLHFLTTFPPADADHNEIVTLMAPMLWRWTRAIDPIERKVQSQFVFGRAVLATATTGPAGPALARQLLSLIRSLADGDEIEYLEQPLIHFAVFYVKAITEKHDATVHFLLAKYGDLISLDSDVRQITARLRNQMRPSARSGFDFGRLMQLVSSGSPGQSPG